VPANPHLLSNRNEVHGATFSRKAPSKVKCSAQIPGNRFQILTSCSRGEKDQEKHFDTRTDEAGNYIFGHIPAGRYTVSIYAWFGKRDEVPCQNPLKQKTADGGDITVEWQWKSQAFMEIVTLKSFPFELERANVKDFDVVGK
jgi:hypothetical protein